MDVLPPSAHGEIGLVLRAAAAIVFGAVFVIGLHAGPGPEPGLRAGDLLPFQVLFRDAPSSVQRMYREMQEGLLEAENARATTKEWPGVDALATRGIPPFAVSRPPYHWRLVRDGAFVNYVGTPTSDGPALLALVQEPERGSPADAAATALDEFHHRLADGTLLHVSIWFRTGAPPPAGILMQPSTAGWTQVVVGRQGS